MRKFSSRLPSPAMAVALTSLFIGLGGTGYAATQLSHSPRAGAAKKHKHKPKPTGGDTNADTALVKSLAPNLSVGHAINADNATHATNADNATHATKADSATSATTATTAATANALTAPEAFHEIGAGGEPAFQNGASNYNNGFSTAAFFKDQEGVVHLKGTINVTAGSNTAFTLPVGYRPLQELDIVAINSGNLSYVYVTPAGDVITHGNAGVVGLDSITFRAQQ